MNNNNILKQIESILYSGKLEQIRLFQINENYFEFPEDQLWIIDGGIELSFPNGTLTIAWASEIDMFIFQTKKFELIYKDYNYIELDVTNSELLENLLYKNITNIKFHQTEMEYIIDYSMKTELQKTLVGVTLTFNNKNTLQLSTVGIDSLLKNAPLTFYYDLESYLLIALDSKVVI